VTGRSSRWRAASGIVLCGLWAPMLLIVPKLPDLNSSVQIVHFYRGEADVVRVVVLLASVGLLFFVAFLGVLVDWLRRAAGTAWLIWTAVASAVVFITVLAIALGLVATAALLSPSSSPQITRALHAAAFVSAAPVAPVGAAFFTAIGMLSFRSGAFSRGLAWASVAAAVANLGAVGGVLSLSGPLNSGNGAVAGIAAPILAWVVWILLASVSLLRAPQPSAAERDPRRLVGTVRQ
jgi:hypothetical protein